MDLNDDEPIFTDDYEWRIAPKQKKTVTVYLYKRPDGTLVAMLNGEYTNDKGLVKVDSFDRDVEV